MFIFKPLLLAIVLCGTFVAVLPAQAQNRDSYLSGTGDDTLSCATPTSACKSFQSTIGKTAIAGTIHCLDDYNFGLAVIDKSISVDCTGTGGSLSPSGGISAISINIPVSPNDLLRSVRLRGITINGAGLFATNQNGSLYGRVTSDGIYIIAASTVIVESLVIANFINRGIYDNRTGGQTKLFVKDSIISGNGGPGIVATSQAPGIMVLDHVSLLNNSYGLAAATGNNVSILNSVISGNTQAGVLADGGAQITVEGSTISNNNIGVLVGGTVRLSDNRIQFNNQAVNGPAISLGGNKYSGNVAIGVTPPLASGASGDVYN